MQTPTYIKLTKSTDKNNDQMSVSRYSFSGCVFTFFAPTKASK